VLVGALRRGAGVVSSRRRWWSGRRLLIAVPYGWLLLFFLVPFFIVLKISFAQSLVAMPPFSALLHYAEGVLSFEFSLLNYLDLYEYPLYLQGYFNSLRVAALSTACCLLLGYPMALALARLRGPLRNICLLLVIMPSWTSFLIRIYAWMGILQSNGLINNALLALGVIDQPLVLLHTPLAVYIGIVYAYLPFMVLPLYASLVRQDESLLEAAADLGARPWQAFLRVTLPLSASGIVAGCMLVFIPALGEFVIPELLGGADTLMIGKLLWSEFFNARNWPGAAAVAVVMLLILLLPIVAFYRYQTAELRRAADA